MVTCQCLSCRSKTTSATPMTGVILMWTLCHTCTQHTEWAGATAPHMWPCAGCRSDGSESSDDGAAGDDSRGCYCSVCGGDRKCLPRPLPPQLSASAAAPKLPKRQRSWLLHSLPWAVLSDVLMQWSAWANPDIDLGGVCWRASRLLLVLMEQLHGAGVTLATGHGCRCGVNRPCVWLAGSHRCARQCNDLLCVSQLRAHRAGHVCR